MLNDLNELLGFKSILGKQEENAPFGVAIANALEYFLLKGKEYGLKAKNIDGYCGYLEYGDGKDMIGVLAHLDVVPVNEGDWSYPPFKLTIDNGNMYGRGVVDNKGPAVVFLHILKTLKEKNIKLDNRIRLIFGCNEENGSECIKHYCKSQEIPKFSIVPDADFPVINSENNIVHFIANFNATEYFEKNFISIKAGERSNVIPDKAVAKIVKNSSLGKGLQELFSADGKPMSIDFVNHIYAHKLNIDDIILHVKADCCELETRGVSGHAMAPNTQNNAIATMISTLYFIDNKNEQIAKMYKILCGDPNKSALGIETKSPESSPFTFNIGLASYNNGDKDFKLTMDMRVPNNIKVDTVVDKFKKLSNCNIEMLHNSKGLYMPFDSMLVKTLLGIYNKAMGVDAKPVQTGGGTYARELPNALAFGPTFPNTKTNIHTEDEYISVEQFDKLFDIYYNAVLELDKVSIK